MLKIIQLTLFLAFVNTALTDEIPEYLKVETKGVHENSDKGIYTHDIRKKYVTQESAVEEREYDVLEYRLGIDISGPLSATSEDSYEKRRTFRGQNTIYMKLLEDSPTIELDAANMTIGSIYVNSSNLDDDYELKNDLLTFQLDDFNKNDTVTIIINYSSIAENIGMHFYFKGLYVGDTNPHTNEKIIVEENIAYTMSEPEMARYWMPCNDRPYDKATSRISLVVPEGFQTSSNGILVDSSQAVADSPYSPNYIHTWENRHPITTYLMVFNASKFDHYQQWFKPSPQSQDSLPIDHYFWAADRDSNYFKAVQSMDSHPAMLEYFSEHFYTYPFDKYGTTAVYPFRYGGMEHQSMSTIHRKWTRDYGDIGFVHEIGHMWFGDLITCATWNDLWFNEGGATWSEALWEGHIKGEEAYREQLYRDLEAYIDRSPYNTSPPMYGLPVDQLFSTYGFLNYNKAAVVFAMLENMIGRNKFLDGIFSIFDEYKYTSMESHQFRDVLADRFPNTMVDIDTFFDQWVFGAGHPEYNLDLELIESFQDGYRYDLSLDQVQENNENRHEKVSDLFITPIRFIFFKDDELKETSEILLNDKKSQNYDLVLDFIPDSVGIDHVVTIHKVLINTVTAVEIDEFIGETKVFPNPVNSGFATLNVKIKQAVSDLEIGLYNALGKKLSNIYTGRLIQGEQGFKVPTENLIPGVYIIKIELENEVITRKLVVAG